MKPTPSMAYTLKDLVEYIDIHYTTVSRVIKKIEREDEK
jgi:DNA-binding MarR family transcriptional regulator